MKAANSDEMIEAVKELSRNVSRVSKAITADDAPGQDEAGVSISSLTEAMMGVTAGLMRIAEAIQDLAEAVRETRDKG